MNTVLNLFRNLWNSIGCIGELLGYLLRFVSVFFQTRASLAARLVAAESQLSVCKRRVEQKGSPGFRFTAGFRLLWVVLSKLWAPWRAAAQLMQPATVKAWHTRAFKFYWRWKSRKKPGRPPISHEMQDLIRKLSRENPLWGAEVIRLTLLKLQYAPPCEDTIRKYMVKPKDPRCKSTTWLPFLRNHMDVSWAIDFFIVTTIRFATLYVFVVLHHGRRKVVHFAITSNPSMGWVIQQLREAMPYGRHPRFLFRDNDGIYGNGVGEFLDSCGIDEVRTAYRSPWQNPFVERFGGTLRRELLDHVIVLGQGHLARLLREFIEDYTHVARPHQGLDGDTPIPQPKTDAPITGPHEADLHADRRRTAPSLPASGGVAAGGLGYSAVGRVDQSALPPARPSLQGHVWLRTIKLQPRNLPTLLANADPKWAVRFIRRARWVFSGGQA